MGGLSELTKQVRHHRQTAERLQIENEKLARQLRIALELKDISVGDLAAALRSACAQEADSELRRRLREVELERDVLVQGGAAAGGNSVGESVADGDRDAKLRADAAEHRVAQAEIENAALSAENDALKALRDDLVAKLSAMEAKIADLEAASAMASPKASRLSARVRRMSDAARQRRNSDAASPPLAVSAETEALRVRVTTLEETLSAKELQLELETSRVADLEGQLRSVYAAYQGVEEEFQKTQSEYDLLKALQEESDAMVAKRYEKMEYAAAKQQRDRVTQQEKKDQELVHKMLMREEQYHTDGRREAGSRSIPMAQSLVVHRHGNLMCKLSGGSFAKTKVYMIVLHKDKLGVFSEGRPDEALRQWSLLPETHAIDEKDRKAKFPFTIENIVRTDKRNGNVSTVTFIAKSRVEKLKWMESILRAARQLVR